MTRLCSSMTHQTSPGAVANVSSMAEPPYMALVAIVSDGGKDKLYNDTWLDQESCAAPPLTVTITSYNFSQLRWHSNDNYSVWHAGCAAQQLGNMFICSSTLGKPINTADFHHIWIIETGRWLQKWYFPVYHMTSDIMCKASIGILHALRIMNLHYHTSKWYAYKWQSCVYFRFKQKCVCLFATCLLLCVSLQHTTYTAAIAKVWNKLKLQ